MTKITIDRAVVEQALEALESGLLIPHSAEVFANLRAALAEPEGGGNLPPPLPAEHYCDTHCTWADHAAGCVRAHGIGGNDD